MLESEDLEKEMQCLESSSAKEEDIVEQEDGDIEVVFSQITPYEDELLAEVNDDRKTIENQEADKDGQIAVNSWFV